MKKIKKFQYTGFLYLPTVFAITYVSYRWPQALVYFGFLTGGVALLTMIMAALPIGRIRFGEKIKKSWVWWFQVLGFQTVLFGVFIATMISYMSLGPFFIEAPDQTLWANLYEHYAWGLWSLFPWAPILIWALCLGYYSQVLKKGPYAHQTMQHVFKGVLEPQGKALVESALYSTNYLLLSLLCATTILLLAYAGYVYFDLPYAHTHLMPITLAFWGVTLLALYGLLRKKGMRLLYRKGVSLWQIVLLVMALLTLSLWGSSFVIDYVVNHPRNPFDFDQFRCGACAQFFEKTAVVDRLAGFITGWWLLATPMAASYLVRISRGQTLRTLVLGFFGLPIVGLTLFYWQSDGLLHLANAFNFFVPQKTSESQAVIYLVLALLCAFVLFVVLRGRTSNQVYYSGMLDDEAGQPRGRLHYHEGVKLMGLSRLSSTIMMAVFGGLMFHALGAWYFIQIQVLILAPFIMHFTYCAAGILMIYFTQNKLWSKKAQ